MRIAVYETLVEERDELIRCEADLGVALECTPDLPSLENASLAKGCEAVSVRGRAPVTAAMLEQWRSYGIARLSTRTIGMNHIDMEAAHELGFNVSNVAYPPNGVAEFTVMLMLMCLRNAKESLQRTSSRDFRLAGLMGHQLSDLTVGVVGAGSIGTQVMRALQGFGCEVLYASRLPKPEADALARFVSLNELLQSCDIVSLHLALTPETRHLIGARELGLMRDGAILVNTARGSLVDTAALEAALDSGRLASLGLDTLEGEEVATCNAYGARTPDDSAWLRLSKRPDVVLTPHIAYYTQANMNAMARAGIEALL